VEVVLGIAVLALLVWWFSRRRKQSFEPADLSVLPECFVVYDLETTGLEASRHEIIEIGAILVNRDSNDHVTFQTLVRPRRPIPKKIRQITGITNEMVEQDGRPLQEALSLFREFVGALPLVAFNAEFDGAFLRAACASTNTPQFKNEVCCALQLARRAWPERKSFRLSDLAKDGNLSSEDTHRALGDCRRTMVVYAAAARRVGTHR
jgi:DNA polymerase III subunit epsilon